MKKRISNVNKMTAVLIFILALCFAMRFISHAEPASEFPSSDSETTGTEEESGLISLDTPTEELLDLSSGTYQFGAIEGVNSDGIKESEYVEEVQDMLASAVANYDENVELDAYHFTVEEITDIAAEFINHNPRYFYLSEMHAELDENSGEVLRLLIDYEDEAATMEEEYEQEVAAVLKGINPSWSDLEKLLYIHDYIATNCCYDLELEKRSAYDALVGHSAVCTGYALAFEDLVSRVGIEAGYVTSKALRHAWNIVNLDGKYYYVDVTWDDPVVWMDSAQTKQGFMYKMNAGHYFFLKSQSEFNHGETDWAVDGKEIYDLYENTEYDNACWSDAAGVTITEEDGIYVIGSGAEIYRCTAANPAGDFVIQVPAVGTYYFSYGSIVTIENRIYVCNEYTIYRLDSEKSELKEVYTLTDNQKSSYGKIYGMQFEGARLRYDMGTGAKLSDYKASDYCDLTSEMDDDYAEVSLDCNYILFTEPGENKVLTAEVTPSGRTVTWNSSDEKVATVDETGKVTAVGYGRTVITASCGEAKDLCIVNFDSVWQKDYEYTNEEDFEGKSRYLYLDDFISDETVIEIPAIGYVGGERFETNIRGKKLVSKTSSQITRQYKGLFSDTPVESVIAEDGVKFGEITTALFRNCSSLKYADLSNTDMTKVIRTNSMFYGCSNLEFISLKGCSFNSLEGTVAMIKYCSNLEIIETPAYLPDGISMELPKTMYLTDEEGYLLDTCYTDLKDAPANRRLSADVRVESISFEETLSGLKIGSEMNLRVIFEPYNARIRTLSWESEDPAIASVDEDGCVTGIAQGTTTITARTTDGGKEAHFTVSVYDDETHTEHIPAEDKGYAATCVSPGLSDGSHCSLCGAVITRQEVIPALGHSIVVDERIEPTFDDYGLTEGSHCDRCHTVFQEQRQIPKLSGWRTIDKYVYYYEDGAPVIGWKLVDEKWYYMDMDGKRLTGWVKTNGLWYYLNASGVMQRGWLKYKNKWYYLSSAMQTGWVKDGAKWYYMDSSGAMQTGWLKWKDNWYYLKSEMQTGWVKVESKWYYMNESGIMQTGWLKWKGKWYYLSSSGSMCTGWIQDNGKWYYLDSSGAWTGR